MRDVAYKGNALACFSSPCFNRVGAETVEEPALLSDCRPFSSFIHSSSLKSATLFIKDSKVYDTVAQINTIYRYKHYFETSGFKTVQLVTVTKTFKNAVSALRKEETF